MYRNNLKLLNNNNNNINNFDHNTPYYHSKNGKTKILYNEDDGYVEYDDDDPSPVKIIGAEKFGFVALTKLSGFMVMLSQLPLPKLSVNGMGIAILLGTFFLPRIFSEILLFPGFRLLFGNLYPAYASYKAVRTKNVKEYVKWMMYWIVFAFFSCIETFTDIFLSWFPFYYEVKVIIVLWLLSPATKGSSTLYRKFVHPMLTKRENEIDEYITQAKEKGYTAVLQLGSKGVNYATNVIMQTAIKTLSNGVQTSQSDNAIADRMHRDRTRNNNNFITDGDDLTDGDEQMIIETESRMRRSQSADSALNRPTSSRYNLRSTPDIIYEDSSEDEMIIHEDKPAPDFTAITGSARSREAPAPKTTSNRTTRTNRGAGVTAPPRPTSSGIRGRRKIKPDPLIEMDQEIVVE